MIFVILALTGAIAYSLAKRAIPQKPVDNVGISLTPTPTPTPAPRSLGEVGTTLPEVTEKTTTKVTKTTICTPVYGSADTCTEHVVVDTGAESAMFFNFAGLAYIGGLLSFVKAKTLKH